MIGETLAHYRILAKLGVGGMGVVYEAEDLNLGRHVALKFLPEALASNPEALARLQREARAASALNHPNIVTLHSIESVERTPPGSAPGDTESLTFLAMERLEGQTLEQRIVSKRVSPERVIELGTQIADALEAAHARGIVHRDLKPANLFITERGDVKVLDFGLAKVHEVVGEPAGSEMPTQAAGQTLTSAGSTMGTVAYMSPEQARGEVLDERTDLFSLGVVLYEMATGRLPFQGSTQAVVYSEILGKAPTPPRELDPTIPQGLAEVLMRALEKDRDLRYQSAADLRSDLKRLARDSGSAAVTAAPSAAEVKVAQSRVRRFGLAVAAIVVIVIVTFLVGRRSSEESDGVPMTGASVQPTVAVLPFQNLGGDTSIDYLGVAVPDEITTALSRVSALTVRPFSSTSGYRGQIVDPVEVGSELGVANIVTGQYFREGDQLQLTLEAIDVAANRLVWRDSLTVPAADPLSLRETVSKRVREGLLPKMGVASELSEEGSKPTSAEAYNLYLQSYAMSSDAGPNERAMELLEQAVEIDPSYASAWEQLAHRYSHHAHFAGGGEAFYRKSLEAANRAVVLDPNVVGAVRTMVLSQVDQGNLFGGYETASALVERRPDSGLALFVRSYVLRYAGLMEEAIEDCRRALDLDPGNPGLRSCAIANFQMSRYDEAEGYLRLVAGSDYEKDVRMHMALHGGRIEVAREVAETYSEDFRFRAEGQLVASCREDLPNMDELVADLDALVESERDSETTYWYAHVYAVCGLRERAFELVQRAIAGNYCATVALETDVSWDPYREDPAFRELIGLSVACRQRFLDYRDKKRAG